MRHAHSSGRATKGRSWKTRDVICGSGRWLKCSATIARARAKKPMATPAVHAKALAGFELCVNHTSQRHEKTMKNTIMQCRYCQEKMSTSYVKGFYECDSVLGCGSTYTLKVPFWLLPLGGFLCFAAFYLFDSSAVAWGTVVVLVVAMFTYKKGVWKESENWKLGRHWRKDPKYKP